jgi:hypothetical protein
MCRFEGAIFSGMSRKTVNMEAPVSELWGVGGCAELEPVLIVRRCFQYNQEGIKILVIRARFLAEVMLQGKGETKGSIRTKPSQINPPRTLQ